MYSARLELRVLSDPISRTKLKWGKWRGIGPDAIRGKKLLLCFPRKLGSEARQEVKRASDPSGRVELKGFFDVPIPLRKQASWQLKLFGPRPV